MDIWTPPGTKIKFDKVAGYDYDKELVSKHLVKGQIYTVYKCDVSNWTSEVELVEFPGVHFNTVCFENLEDYDINNVYSKRIQKEWNEYTFGVTEM